MSATAGSANSLTTWAPTDLRGRTSDVGATSVPARTRSGTSTSRAFCIQLGNDRYLKTSIFGLLDDHSRYVLGLRIATGREIDRHDPRMAVRLHRLCGRPLDLMSD